MRKTFILSLIFFAAFFASCSKTATATGGEFRVHGTTSNPRLEGACIYLIALDASIRDSVGIDSTFIKDGKFEISTTKSMMGILRVDYHHRYNIEDLLVVEEAGDLYANIDSVSSAHGTPNNDALQRWKNVNAVYRTKNATMAVNYTAARTAKDSVTMNKIKSRVDSLYLDFKQQTYKIADGLDDGPLKEFFYKMYPNR